MGKSLEILIEATYAHVKLCHFKRTPQFERVMLPQRVEQIVSLAKFEELLLFEEASLSP